MPFQELLKVLVQDYSQITFTSTDYFSWNLEKYQITYKTPDDSKEENKSANKLLHELAHAILNHSDYSSDAELLKVEANAWDLAQDLCKKYEVKFNKKERDEALASYINWASSRSKCPKCQKNGLQAASTKFLCPNCAHKWSVGTSRFTRTYRH